MDPMNIAQATPDELTQADAKKKREAEIAKAFDSILAKKPHAVLCAIVTDQGTVATVRLAGSIIETFLLKHLEVAINMSVMRDQFPVPPSPAKTTES